MTIVFKFSSPHSSYAHILLVTLPLEYGNYLSRVHAIPLIFCALNIAIVATSPVYYGFPRPQQVLWTLMVFSSGEIDDLKNMPLRLSSSYHGEACKKKQRSTISASNLVQGSGHSFFEGARRGFRNSYRSDGPPSGTHGMCHSRQLRP